MKDGRRPSDLSKRAAQNPSAPHPAQNPRRNGSAQIVLFACPQFAVRLAPKEMIVGRERQCNQQHVELPQITRPELACRFPSEKRLSLALEGSKIRKKVF